MRVLIAEDDPFTRNALCELFRAESWDPVPAADGTKAWEAFGAGSFDLACLDIMMPGMSGYDLCRRIREKAPDLPLLFISAKSEEIDRVLGLELGADDFIAKPFGAREVMARVRAVMRRSTRPPETSPGQAADDSFGFGPWTVVPSELRARAAERVIDLSAREVSLLGLLAKNPGKVLSRQMFFEQCWGWENAPQSRTLDQHIAVLRKKLGSPELIHTVQGIGYRFQA